MLRDLISENMIYREQINKKKKKKKYMIFLNTDGRATENRFFAGSDRFLVCKTDSICIKRIFSVRKKHTLWIIYWPNFLD